MLIIIITFLLFCFHNKLYIVYASNIAGYFNNLNYGNFENLDFKIRSTMRKEVSDAGLCGKTIDSYMSYLNHLIKFMEDQSLDNYTGDVGELFFHMTRNNSTLTGEEQTFIKWLECLIILLVWKNLRL